MKKQFLNLGKALNKAEQKSIKGGRLICGTCSPTNPCCGDGFCLDKMNMGVGGVCAF